MFCQQCGTQIEDGLAFCTNCGAKQVNVAPESNSTESSNTAQPVTNRQYVHPDNQFNQLTNQQGFVPQGYVQPDTYAYTGANTTGSPQKVSFGEAIKLFFVNYVNFTGRSTVSEYWWGFLFNFLVSLATSWILVVGPIVLVGLLLPGLALSIRRLHDTGKSWVYILMGLIPLAGFIILIVQFCKGSDADNKWGPAPGK